MRQAQVTAWGQAPQVADAPELPAPGPDEVRVKVEAVGIHQVVRSRASGKHYSSGPLPHIPGVDGVGTTDDGQHVYFSSFQTGGLAQYVNIPRQAVRPLPSGIDPVQAAGFINPIMSSWMAFTARTTNLPKDFKVLILGATTASGRCAITVARSLGAKHVVGVARNQATLATLGLDETVVIGDNVEDTDFSVVKDVDVIVDYLFGTIALHMLKTIPVSKPTQYVQIGSLAGLDIEFPGAILRSKDLTIRGAGPGAWSMQQLGSTMGQMLDILKAIPEQPLKVVKLEDVEQAWNEPSKERVVVIL